ncbi:MAG: stage III sporulation protein AB [Oscillospiraceae bacterium]|nr:stage III sporulation protein AB [Oscillospiraceae bacterium]
MLRIIGALLLTGGTTAFGLQASAQLSKCVSVIAAWRMAVEQLQAEMSCRVRALPELAAHLADNAPAILRGDFQRLADMFERPNDERYAQIWTRWAEGLPLHAEESIIIIELGQLLGRYELDGQLAALDSVEARLAQIEERAQVRKDKLSRLYAVSGLLCGAAAAVILL